MTAEYARAPNLVAESMVLSLPDTKGRYCPMPLLDAWTNILFIDGSWKPPAVTVAK